MNTRPVALITGSGKHRVGNVIAETLADHRHDIALHYFRSEIEAKQSCLLLRTKGIRAEVFRADLADPKQAEGLIDQTLSRFGRIDVSVNAAAIWEAKSLEDVTAADVRRHWEINTLATFLCARKAGLAMVGQPTGGVIINIADWAIERPYTDYAAYFSSKGAIPTLTRSLAVELGTRNPAVRVNCLLPGPVMLPDSISKKEREQIIRQTLVKREGKPEDIAHAVLFLIQNQFITGACIPVDGGRTIYAQ